MKAIALALLVSAFALVSMVAPASAQSQGTALCQMKAIDKNSTPLTGAAKTSFMTQCQKDSCEASAIDKNGHALAGAAKTSFMTKCQGG
jgi:guanyl-specific ribonuclease Sa